MSKLTEAAKVCAQHERCGSACAGYTDGDKCFCDVIAAANPDALAQEIALMEAVVEAVGPEPCSMPGGPSGCEYCRDTDMCRAARELSEYRKKQEA